MKAGGVAIESLGDGSALYVKAHPGSRREGIDGVHDGMLKIAVSAAPEKGKANKAIAKILAKRLGVAPSSVVLLSGDSQKKKRFALKNLPPEQLESRLRTLLEQK